MAVQILAMLIYSLPILSRLNLSSPSRPARDTRKAMTGESDSFNIGSSYMFRQPGDHRHRNDRILAKLESSKSVVEWSAEPTALRIDEKNTKVRRARMISRTTKRSERASF